MWLATKFGFFSVVCGRTECSYCKGTGKQFPAIAGQENKCGHCQTGTVLTPDMLIIRARRREHLEQLIQAANEIAKQSGTAIKFDSIMRSGSDYPYRTKISRMGFIALAIALTNGIDYDNLKDAAAAEHPEDLEYRRFLHATWAEGRRMQDGRKLL